LSLDSRLVAVRSLVRDAWGVGAALRSARRRLLSCLWLMTRLSRHQLTDWHRWWTWL